MPVILLLVAVVIFACVLLNRVSGKLGMPTLLAFIVLGMIFGSDGLLKIPFDNYAFAEQICSVALIFIMFYGGFGTNWKHAKPVAVRAILLSSLGVVFTAGLVGLFCRFVLGFGWLESFLMGSVIGSTDAASVFSILRSKKLGLRYNTASLLEVESGSNDPFSYMLTAIVLFLMQGTVSAGGIAYMIFAQLVYGIGFGIVLALLATFCMKRIRFSGAGFDTIFVLGIAILAYAAPAAVGGNGYLSAYIVGIVLGNTEFRGKKTLVPFFDGITGLMQMLIFFLLGLLAFPSRIPHVLPVALAIALFLTLVARPLAVFALMIPFKGRLRQMLTVSWAGLRGAASIVFAMMAMMQTQPGHDIFHIVFCIVLFSILLQGATIPWISKKLGMIDKDADVMKTFSDYSEEIPVQFVRSMIKPGHPWCDAVVRDLILPPDTLLVMIQRNGKNIVPRGKTVLHEGDALVLSAKSSGHIEGVHLSERLIDANSKYLGKTLSEMPNSKDALVILILRKKNVVIPNGRTVIREGDVLVINHPDEA